MSPVTQRQHQQQQQSSGGGHNNNSTSTIPQQQKKMTINTNEFYGEYHGHKIKHLKSLHTTMRNDPNVNRIIWTAGDSSLDNKYWFQDIKPAVPNTAYSQLLQPPHSNADITYYMNLLCQQQNESNQSGGRNSNSHRSNWATINTAGTCATTLPVSPFFLLQNERTNHKKNTSKMRRWMLKKNRKKGKKETRLWSKNGVGEDIYMMLLTNLFAFFFVFCFCSKIFSHSESYIFLYYYSRSDDVK